ncbi:fimbrillin family protein [Mucilaginibacter jinjuensis]|uniref:Fimbrillin family protein n=1 Tax=Mucilaginibacter jinjuensis TaxID=1176721 RepID=A0ABY7T6U8_9SPHI|nr:fimbrillin family protein [Mucilaginibacter jinjuensis]WCT11571.1 fimbrillin family protein [Mucilaginibacter jinjuensis]
MKTQNILIASAMTLLALGSSCKKDNKHDTVTPNPTLVKFTAAINGQIKTKATNDKWDTNDAIGVFMKIGTGLTNILAANKSYATTGDGAFAPTNTDQNINYPEDGTVDFIAYYPYKQTLTNNKYPVDVATQTNQAAIDLLYANNATGLSKTSTVANLVFSHQLSKIEFTVKAGTGVTDLTGLTASLAGLNTKADFDLATGVLSNASQSADVSAKTTAQTGSVLAEAIVLPVADASGKVVTFTLPAGQFKLTLPANTKFEAGKKYTYEISLTTGSTPQPTAVALSATITNWTSVPSGSYTVGEDQGSTTPPTGVETVLFTETFGTGTASTKPKVSAYTAWDNASFTFTDTYGNADLRTISTYPNDIHVWLPATKDASLKIAGIPVTGYTKLKLKYDLAPNAPSASSTSDFNVITVKVNGVSIAVPSSPVTNANNNKFTTIELSDITPQATNTIEFMGSATTNTLGMRLDNVVIIGIK